MSLVLIVRHATAADAGPGISDIDRQLTAAGREEAMRIGDTLARLGLAPDLALCSPAMRARQTLDGLQERLPAALRQVRFADRLYSGTWRDYLDAAKAGGAETLLIVGHNPMVAQLALNLTGSGDEASRSELGRGFGKAAMAVLRLDGPLDTLAPGAARIEAVHRHGG